jgi:diguanylate cyclase (GGDEF)-like protein/PAS domain S-box-containing protein
MNSYENLSKEQLIQKVNELSVLLQNIQSEKNQQELLNFPWVGNLGNWQWYYKTNRVTFNDQKVIALGYSRSDIPDDIGFEFFTEKIHKDDYTPVMENMRAHLYGKSSAYECNYRIQKKDGTWIWFYDRGVITSRDKDGKPELITGIVFDITEQKRKEELLSLQTQRLEEVSRTDFLTDLHNRRSLFERIDYETKRSARTKDPLSIIMLDIDHFKQVNDQFGHLMGDKVLVEVAKIIVSSVRVTDIVGRYGGEEFLIILPACTADNAFIVAEQIRESVALNVFDDELRITISGGVHQFRGESIDQCIDAADQLLYQAKRNGRNRSEIDKDIKLDFS